MPISRDQRDSGGASNMQHRGRGLWGGNHGGRKGSDVTAEGVAGGEWLWAVGEVAFGGDVGCPWDGGCEVAAFTLEINDNYGFKKEFSDPYLSMQEHF